MAPLLHIPGYELLRSLGGGPLTEVFAARRSCDDRACAVKLPRENWPGYATSVRLLRREYRALRDVRHPNLVRLIDARVTDPPYFLVLDFLDGETLRERLQREYSLDLRSSVWVARQIAEALSALHRLRLVHGDVKPENIRLMENGTAVLIDLGFTHRVGETGVFADEGYVLGTANYLAPELRGDSPQDGLAADWFSFGVMLLEMLTGRLPHSRESMSHRLDDSLPPRLLALLNRLLARQPITRPNGAFIVHELIALEIAALGRRKAG